jgi:hypothetical protein
MITFVAAFLHIWHASIPQSIHQYPEQNSVTLYVQALCPPETSE